MYIFVAVDLNRNFTNVDQVFQHTNNLIDTGFTQKIEMVIQDDLAILFESRSEFGCLEKQNDRILSLISGYRDSGNQGDEGEYSRIKIFKDRVVAYSDFSGSCPIFYGVNNGIAAISNDVFSIAIFLGFHSISLNSAIELVKYSHCIGRETTIDGVYRVWPEEELHLEISANAITTSNITSTKLDYVYNSPNLKDDAIDVAFEKLLRNTERNFKNTTKSLCQLSGGLDSRLTVAILSQIEGREINTFHMILSDDYEAEIASQIADKLNTKHHSVALDCADLEMAKKAWILTAGQVGVDAAAGNLVGYKYALENGFNQIIGGWQGDCLIGSYVPSESLFVSNRLKKLAIKSWVLNRGYSDDEICSVFQRISKKSLRKLRKKLRKEIEKKDFKTAAQQVSWWGMFRRQPTFSNISPARLCSNLVERTPLLAPEYIKELLKLQGSDLINKNFYRKMIWNKCSKLRKVKYANTGKELVGDYDLTLKSLNLRRLIYTLFPMSLVLNLYKKYLNRRNNIAYLDEKHLNESSHWRVIFEKEVQIADSNSVWGISAENIKSENSAVHFLGVFLALEWSRKYLAGFK